MMESEPLRCRLRVGEVMTCVVMRVVLCVGWTRPGESRWGVGCKKINVIQSREEVDDPTLQAPRTERPPSCCGCCCPPTRAGIILFRQGLPLTRQLQSGDDKMQGIDSPVFTSRHTPNANRWPAGLEAARQART